MSTSVKESIKHNYMFTRLTEAWSADCAQNVPLIAQVAKSNRDNTKMYIL